ncbi:MAG: TIP41-domain-containing protein [Monoraphidium minutum]|nr:MAG: TIP41-domain-containing protein [Monoraphidium minutum]
MAPYVLDEDGRGITVGGWRVRTRQAPIIGDAAVEAAARALGGVLTVPEILFGDSGLELVHAASGLALSFSALDALRAWRSEDLPPLKVSVAQQWQAARREEIARQQAVVLSYDWTYTTPYQGTLARGGGADGGQQQQQPALPRWRPTTRQADRGLLLSRDEPILFYAEVPLYESELDDNGSSQLVAKVRVMPRCWLLLLRFWLRVDGSLVRLRETRLFCRFDQPGSAGVVLRETKHCEGTVAQLRAAGAPVSPNAYTDGDAAAAVFSAIAPACLARYELHELDMAG